MSFRNHRQRSPQITSNGWNCLTPKVKEELFLSKKNNRTMNDTTLQKMHKKNSSGELTGSPQKISLKNRKEKSIKGSKNLVEVDQESIKEIYSPIVSPPVSDISGFSKDFLFYQPQSATYRNKINYNKQQRATSSPFIDWNIQPMTPGNPPVNINFNLLSPARRIVQPDKSNIRTEEKADYDNKIQNGSLRTTKVASNSESRKKIQMSNSDQFPKTTPYKPSNLNLLKFKQMEKQIEKEKKGNEHSKHSTFAFSSEQITHSLMIFDETDNGESKHAKEDKESTYSCRNFNSERLVKHGKKVARMSEVEEIKSLADSQQNNDNDSDKESIVLQTLEELTRKGNIAGNKQADNRKPWKVFGSTQLERIK